MSHNKDERELLNNSCFNLQFRRDIRRERPGQPAYFRWVVQFVLLEEIEFLKKIKIALGCGRIYEDNKNQARFVVQDIDSLYKIVIPFLSDYKLSEKRKKDFFLWKQAVKLLYKNKGKITRKWKKKDFQKIMEIQKKIQGYKLKPKSAKWLSEADLITKNR